MLRTFEISQNIKRAPKSVAFKGYKAYTNDYGFREHKFFLPYDPAKYSAKIEMVPFRYDKKYGHWVKDPESERGTTSTDLPVEGAYMSDIMLFPEEKDAPGLSDKAMGYRYVLTPHNNESYKIYSIDQGTLNDPSTTYNEDKFTILPQSRRPIIGINGLTKQVLPDICMPGYQFNKDNKIEFNNEAYLRAYHAVRNHGNKLNGNFAGIIKMLPQWEKEGYTKIVGTPFTRDDVSSHLYWTQNVYQVAKNLGTIDDFKKLQVELFKHGINWVADGAFVNQGLQGVHFRYMLKHGLNAPTSYWFKSRAMESDPLTLGVIPRKASQYTRFRLVNAEEIMYEENGKLKFKTNPNYDKTKQTYLQMYDSRMATPEELSDTQKLIESYSKTNTDNPYEITGHDDITQPIAFPINYYTFRLNTIKTFNQLPDNAKTLHNPETLQQILKFKNFRIGYKDKGGFDLWDGNMDIAKLSFCLSNIDQKYIDSVDEDLRSKEIDKFYRAIYQVQDYAIQAGRYWTRLASDTQMEYAAKLLSNGSKDKKTKEEYKKIIDKAIENNQLPKSLSSRINEDIIENALSGWYFSPRLSRNKKLGYIREALVLNEIMNFPLDSIEFGWDLTAVLSSPFISKRANNEIQLEMSRYDLKRHYDAGNISLPKETEKLYKRTDKIFKEELSECVLSVLDSMSRTYSFTNDRKIFDSTMVTPYGRYAIPLIMPDLLKFIIVKSFAPDAQIKINGDGTFDYSNVDLENISLKSLRINGSPEVEADLVLDRLKEGIIKLSGDRGTIAKLAENFIQRLNGINLDDFRLAEALLDKSESGLGWRIDAAKDIANIDALRLKLDSPSKTMEEVTKFWGRFNQAVLKENYHAYSTAEITDLGQFIQKQEGQYKNYIDAETKFIEQSGINNTANYMFFFSMLKNLFSRNAEDGSKTDFENILKFKDNMDGTNGSWAENSGFLYTYPSDSTTFSYTFLGNHDKPRPLHIFALDMELFHAQLRKNPDKITNDDERQSYYRTIKIASEILKIPEEQVPLSPTSGKAVAMAKRIKDALYASFDFKYADKEDDKGNTRRVLVRKSDDDYKSASFKKEDMKYVELALKDLASGIFKTKSFNPDAFGSRPIDMAINDVIEQAKVYGLNLSKADEENIKSIAFEIILKPAMEKFKTTYKMLVTLPGSPTDFIGDKEGSTGYETKSNNDFQQNRNFVHYEWINKTLNDNYIMKGKEKDFVNDFYNDMNKIGSLRSMPKLSALCDGATVSLKLQENNVYGTFRYNDKGSEVITLYTTSGATENNEMVMEHPPVSIEKIDLSVEGQKQGLGGGLDTSAIFRKVELNPKNVNPGEQREPEAEYRVCEESGKYYIKKFVNGVQQPITIEPSDINTLILYKETPKAYNPTEELYLDHTDVGVPQIDYAYSAVGND